MGARNKGDNCRIKERRKNLKDRQRNPHMAETRSLPPVISPTDAGAGGLITGSPKAMYVFFLLSLCRNYFEVMRVSSPEVDIESATAALIAFCPNRTERERIWKLYVDERDKKPRSVTTASVTAVGELVSYLSLALDFEEESTGGLM